MSLARTLMIQGTASNVGKSLIVAALCRVFAKRGLRVAPFKAQNMSNNAAVCPGGGEIGRAQALQAAACGLEPQIDMNPILLKPCADVGSQVVLRGRPLGTLAAADYQSRKKDWLPLVAESLARLRAAHDLVLIEGAGSPAEVNLRDADIVNMRTAELAEAPVLLAGDIDCGGIFAQLIGTLMLLRPWERQRVRGLLVNKFRGDPGLMQPGLDFLESETGLPVLGLLPYLRDLRLPEEDAVGLRSADPPPPTGAAGCVSIEVVRHPRIANFTDFDALRAEPDVALHFVERPGPSSADAVVLPGTKSTIADLRHLREVGLADHVVRARARGAEIIGICGGFQMLGERIHDPSGVESSTRVEAGLGLLPATTLFGTHKATQLVRARHLESGLEARGYEIHMGQTQGAGEPVFEILERDGGAGPRCDGLRSPCGRVWGTYLHGLFDAPALRHWLLDRLRARKGLPPRAPGAATDPLPGELDRLATWAEQHLDLARLEAIVERGA